jgi:hypothetical protein
MHEPTDDFLDKTRTFWQSRTGRQLTAEDARQIAANVSGFLQTLLRWNHNDTDECNVAVRQGGNRKRQKRKRNGPAPTVADAGNEGRLI